MDKQALILVLCLCLVLTTCFSTAAMAEESSTGGDPAVLYERGTAFYGLGKYDEAMESFQQCETYQDSSLWVMFCEALLDIQNNNMDSISGKDREVFNFLTASGFSTAEGYATYCTGRSYEALGLRQGAIEQYASILSLNILDTATRYGALMGWYTPLPDETPQPISQSISWPATLIRGATLRGGPGTEYAELDSLRAESPVSLIEAEASEETRSLWAQVEYTAQDGLARGWVLVTNLSLNSTDYPVVSYKHASRRRLSMDWSPLSGPGEGFKTRGKKLKAGTYVNVLKQDMGWNMIAYEGGPSGNVMRAWLPSEAFGD